MNSHPDDLNLANTPTPSDGTQEVLEGETPASRDNPSAQPAAKETGVPDAALLNLREQLQELRQRFDATDAQIAGYLRDQAGIHRGSMGNGEGLVHVQHSLDRLLSRFEELAPLLASEKAGDPASTHETPPPNYQEVLEAIKKLADFQNHLAGKIVNAVGKRLSEELDMLRFQQIVHETLTTEWDRREAEAEAKAQRQAEEEALALAESELEIELQGVEEEEDVPPEEEPSAEAWSRAIWGPELVASEGVAPFLSELNRRLLAGDAGIATLAGQLLVFRQSPPEAKPQILKDVGEAYYRTRLDAALPDHPFEHALIAWLQKECERVGLPNTIEIVHVGERFDKSRHSSTTRGGAEVADVFGWVVLTEGGRVYTRASVAAH